MAYVLIAGCGYVGAALGDLLHGQGHDVLGVTRSPESAKALQEKHPWPVEVADVTAPASLASLASPDEFDAVVHCASSGRGGAEAYRTVFLEGARNLIAAFPGVRLVFTSSTSVYGQTDGSLVTEDSPAEPDRETGRLLRATEDMVTGHGGIVFRLGGIYGPGRSVYLEKILAGTAAIESGPVSRWLNQIHRDDAAAALATGLGAEHCRVSGLIFNAVDDAPLTQRECYEGLARHFNLPPLPETPPDLERKRAWTHKRVDNSRLKSLGWRPRYPSYLAAVRDEPLLTESCRPRR